MSSEPLSAFPSETLTSSDAKVVINIYGSVHVAADNADRFDQIDSTLRAVESRLSTISAQEKTLMSNVTEVKQLVTDIDAETNDVAAKVDAQTAKIDELQKKLDAGGAVTQEDLDAIAGGLAPISARLKAIGSNPEQPIPTPAQ